MKKIFALFLAVFALIQGAAASGIQDNIIITTKDGSTVSYSLTSLPTASFEGTVFVFKAGDVTVNFPVDDIDNIAFGEPTAINDVKQSHITFAVTATQIATSGLSAGDMVEVFSIDGKNLASARADQDGAATVNISALSQGVYVVKAGKQTYKILK
ncbi:MAG: T9SS type A sorting domain-containing protein [Bacteroidales bacterium]|nr:T9SS type A sorting domain-containing protein [Bacteroidales bacterium]